MKIGVNIKIDVTKIDKARLFQGKKGTYLDLSGFIDTDKKGQHGDNGFLTQSLSKEERDNNVQLPILGNTTVFYTDEKDRAAHPEGVRQAQQVINPTHQDMCTLCRGSDPDCPECGIPF